MIPAMMESSDKPVNVDVVRINAYGERMSMKKLVQKESVVRVFIDGTEHATLTCSSSDVVDLAIGHLFIDGIIDSADDIAHVAFDRAREQVNVTLSNAARERTRRAHVRFVRGSDPWNAEAVFNVVRFFERDITDHAHTHGVHSAYLADRSGQVLCVREDIGRHNAFDKVVGWAILHHVNLSCCMLFSSGRIPLDVVAKALACGIPLLVSKAAPTEKAVMKACETGLSLVCMATSESLCLMSGELTSKSAIDLAS